MISRHTSRKPHRTLGLLFATALASLLLVRPVRAADDPESAKKTCETAMVSWLNEIDSGAYAQSWSDASGDFQKAVTSDTWKAQLAAVRGPLGKCLSRTVASALYNDKVPNKPGLVMIMVQFKSSFEGIAYAVETVTFIRDGDTWKAAGYYIKPA